MIQRLAAQSPIETRRLILRILEVADAEALRVMTDEPVITDNIHFLTTPFTRDDAQRLIEGDGGGRDRFWGVWRRDNLTLIGAVGTHLKGTDEIEIGYWFAGAAHGHGFGTEAVAAIVRAIREVYADRQILAECRPENNASWRLLEKVGFRADGREGQRSGRRRLVHSRSP